MDNAPKKSFFDHQLSFKQFIISQLLILIIGSLIIGALGYLLKEERVDWKDRGPVTRKPISFNLELNNPEDESLVFEKSLVVSGKTSPKATVLISAQSTIGLEANGKGEFYKVVDLSPGVNVITVEAFDQDGSQKTAKRVVYFSEEKI